MDSHLFNTIIAHICIAMIFWVEKKQDKVIKHHNLVVAVRDITYVWVLKVGNAVLDGPLPFNICFILSQMALEKKKGKDRN